MDLIFKDNITNETKSIKNTSIIPRIGERIFLGYTPAPKITDVIYAFDENIVTIVLDAFFTKGE